MGQSATTWGICALAIGTCATVAACGTIRTGGSDPPAVSAQTSAFSSVSVRGQATSRVINPRAQPTLTPVADTYCAKAPAALVGPVLGVPAHTLDAIVDGPVTMCIYGIGGVSVRFATGESAAEFAAERSAMNRLGETVTKVSGLADAAFFARYVTPEAASDTLQARKGPITIIITSPAGLQAERALMIALLAKT
jgi:hypothetical protein